MIEDVTCLLGSRDYSDTLSEGDKQLLENVKSDTKLRGSVIKTHRVKTDVLQIVS